MNKTLLIVKELRVTVEGKVVLDHLDFQIEGGEVVVLTGANGSGKTSLAQVLMGNSEYQVINPEEVKISFDGLKLLTMSVDERVKAGLFVAWQNPISIPGVSVFSLCRVSYDSIRKARGHESEFKTLVEFKQKLESLAVRVGLTKEHVGRDVNGGFSGGERKRLELLQLLLLKPKLVILDEIDSGLDAQGIKLVIEIVNELKLTGTAFILITHNKHLLSEILIDRVCEMKYGRLSAGI